MSGIKTIDQNNKTIENIHFRPGTFLASNLRPKTRKSRGQKAFSVGYSFY